MQTKKSNGRKTASNVKMYVPSSDPNSRSARVAQLRSISKNSTQSTAPRQTAAHNTASNAKAQGPKTAGVKRAKASPGARTTQGTRTTQSTRTTQGTRTTQSARSAQNTKTAQRTEFKATRSTAYQKRRPKGQKKAVSREEINRKLSTQTPTRREEAKKAKKLGGGIKNFEVKHHSKNHRQRFYVKKKKTGLGKLLLARLSLFFLMFLLVGGIVCGIFALNLHSGSIIKSPEYTLQMGEDIPEEELKDTPKEERPQIIALSSNVAMRNGQLYIPISALSDMCSLTVTGTEKDLRYLPRESEGQSVRFLVGSSIAYVNDAKMRMIAPSFVEDSKLYIPVDFLEKYSKGLVISHDEVNRKLTVFRYVEGIDEESGEEIEAPLTFLLSEAEPLASIPEPTDEAATEADEEEL